MYFTSQLKGLKEQEYALICQNHAFALYNIYRKNTWGCIFLFIDIVQSLLTTNILFRGGSILF